MTLKTTVPFERVDGIEAIGFSSGSVQANCHPVTEQEQRCTQDLLAIMAYMRRVVAYDREGSGFPITMQQFLVLKMLKDQERLISELADLFKVSRPTMTRIIDGLEGRRRHVNAEENTGSKERHGKLVERVDSPDDRRLVYARITPEGREMLTYYYGKTEECVTTVLRRLPLEEFNQLESSLQSLRYALEMVG